MESWVEADFDHKNEWNALAGHPLQSWEWGEFRGKRQKVSRLALSDGGNYKRVINVIWTRLGRLPWQIGYAPMIKLPNKQDLSGLIAAAKANRAIFVRIEPLPGQNGLELQEFEQIKGELKTGRSLFKKKTRVVNLTLNEEDLLKQMHPKGRYNIRVGLKHGVKVSQETDLDSFNKYLQLMFSGTAKRQKIFMHNYTYHQQMWDSLSGSGIAKLFLARVGKDAVAAAILYCFKETAYYAYGASELEHKEAMAPTGLLWEMIRWAKSKGFKYFDMWGSESGKGFSRFKEQFGGNEIELPGSFDLPTSPLYRLFRIAEELRWKIIHNWK